MPDSNRLESPAPTTPAGRDSRAETLLLEGLDQYFAGCYESAIHLWTRVLFLDRAHSRARAYIDRARTAMAERQRHADELLEAGHALLGQGRTRAARHLLDEVMAEGGDDERVSALRGRLDRLEQFERLARVTAARVVATPPREVVPVWTRPRRAPTALMLMTLAGIAGLLGMLVGPRLSGWIWFGQRPAPVVASAAPLPWPVLSPSDVALVRARNAVAAGRPADALQDLDRVRVDSPVRAEADELRSRIRQSLAAEVSGRSRTEAGRR